MTVQLRGETCRDEYASRRMLVAGSLLVGIEADVEVGCKNRGHSDSGTVISQGLYGLSVPGDRGPKRPNEICHKINDPGLIKAIEHVKPELEAGVFQATDAANV